MGKGHANLDLKLKETSDTACGLGASVAGYLEARRGTGHNVNMRLELYALLSSAPYRVAGRVCSEEPLPLIEVMNGFLIPASAHVDATLSENPIGVPHPCWAWCIKITV